MTRKRFGSSPWLCLTLLIAGGLAAPLGAQSVRLNGPLARFPGSVSSRACSPDGRSVVYLAQQDSALWELYHVSILGGPTTRLSAPSPYSVTDFAIAPDSSHVIYSTDAAGLTELFSVPITGGTAVELDDSPETDGLAEPEPPRISPDGSRVFFHVTAPNLQVRLYSVPITGGTPVLLSGLSGSADKYEITPDSTQVVFSGTLGAPNSSELYRVPVNGSSAPVRISPPPTTPGGQVDGFELSRDGNWVVFASTIDTSTPTVYSASLAGGPLHVLDLPSNSRVALHPIVSGDSTRALFLDAPAPGPMKLFSAPLDGSVPAVPINGTLNVEAFSSTPDGSHVLVVEHRSPSHPRALYSVPVDGGALVPLVEPGLRFDARGGESFVSHDGARVFYTAEHGLDARVGLYAVAVTGGPSIELYPTLYPPLFPSLLRFAPDDTRVALLDEITRRLVSVPTTGAPVVDLTGAGQVDPTRAGQFEFTPDARSLLVLGPLQQPLSYELFRVPVRGGRPVQLNGPLAAIGTGSVGRFAVLPNEQHVAYAAQEVDYAGSQLFAVDAQGLARVRLDPAEPAGASIESTKFTADGRRTLFVRSLSGGLELDSVLSDGGDAHTLALAQSGFLDFAPSPRGTLAVYLGDPLERSRYELFAVSIRGGAPLRLNAPLVAGGDVRSFQFAPRGGRVLYIADQDQDEHVELYGVNLAAATRVRLNGALAAGTSVADFAITADGTRVVFRTRVPSGLGNGLFGVPSDGSAAASEILRPNGTPAPVSSNGYRLTPDGASVVFTADSRLYRAPLAGGPTVELGLDVVQAGDRIDNFEVAPGSAEVAFTLQRPGSSRRLFSAPLGGGNSRELIGDGEILDFRFTPLGDRMAFTTAPPFSNRHLFVAPVAGGPGTRISGSRAVSSAFQLDPGGVFAAFVDPDSDLYVTRLDGVGGPALVNAFDANVGPFTLGRERVFYLAALDSTPGSAELFERPFSTLP